MGASSKSDKLYLLIQLETIDVNSDSYKKVNDELQNQISGAIVTTCLDQSLEPLTRQGAVVRYSFFDAKQVFVEAIDTDKRDCLELLGTR
jgi:DNA-binding HxlR family transcriptional regulator